MLKKCIKQQPIKKLTNFNPRIMKKYFFTLLFFFLGALLVNAQGNYFYYYKGEKVLLTLDKKLLNIITKAEFSKTSISNLNLKDFELVDNDSQKNAIIEYSTEPSDIEFYQKLNALKSNVNINHVNLFFKRNEHISIGISNIFYIKLKSDTEYNILEQIATQKNLQIIKQIPNMPLWYMISLKPNSSENSLDLTNQLWESNLFADVDAGFLFNFKNNCTNDPNFGSLWGLNNTANPNIDINACQAWTISQGSGIKVAVVDGSGIELTHNDLAASILPLSYNMETGTSPSQVTPDDDHSTHIAGTIAAIKDNNLQVVGVAPLSKIMSISHSGLLFPNTAAGQYASGISWAWQNGADVINCSWGDQAGAFYTTFHSTILENAISDAMSMGRNGKGSVIVFASGNRTIIDYPGNFHPDIITVGGINQTGQRAVFPPNQESAYGTSLDVVAPGFGILSTSLDNTTLSMNGTSMAAPHVAGIAALILSANPCLTRQQVATIIENTSQKVGGYSYIPTVGRVNGTWNNEMGYGLVDAYAAVQMAQSLGSATPDLYIKDNTADTGLEPNPTLGIATDSPDIWIRNQIDTIEENQIAISNTTNYIYVKVRNKSCTASFAGNAATDRINLYLSAVSPSISDPTSRITNTVLQSLNYDLLDSQVIPTIGGGQYKIFRFAWTPPITWVPCCGTLIAGINITSKIVSSNDPMAVAETPNAYANIIRNNNISAKNNIQISSYGGGEVEKMMIFNPQNEPKSYKLELIKEADETGKSIYNEAEVSIKMDDVLYNAWQRGGKQQSNTVATNDAKKQLVAEDHVLIDNIELNAFEKGAVEINFNFLTAELTNKTNYKYHILQRDKATNEIVGAVTYTIRKQPRPIFVADAGADIEKDLNETITISASQISEPASYNWYDTQGNLIFQGKDLTIATQVAQKYKLEVIATSDGFKDYSEVEVNLKPSVLNAITPNPANENVTITYKLNQVGSAYLMVIGGYATADTSSNYILDINNTQTNLNISNYPSGFYTVALVCNGQIVDAKTLVKQ
jgi:subtilisin family serine protease